MTTPTNTLEILDAAISAAYRWQEDFTDGKQSLMERVAWVGEFNPIRAAVKGIAEVPQELLEMDAEGLAAVKGRVDTLLVAMGFTSRSRDIAGILVARAVSLIRDIILIKKMPPSAELVD